MKFDVIEQVVGKVPFISKENAKFLYNFIQKEKITTILELGIAHGTATCYMAAALDESQSGQITAVDLLSVKDAFVPSAELQLQQSGLEKYVEIFRMHTGYNWFLHDEILRNTQEGVCLAKYDLCIIDGPKNWTIDSSAFFLVDKLLKEGGYIIFDDLNWSYAKADASRAMTDGITHRTLSQDELSRPHIKDIFELLVMQHPSYGEFTLFADNQWAMAKKIGSQTVSKREVAQYDPSFELDKKYFFSKSFSHFFNSIEALKRAKKRYLVYGFGSVAKVLWSMMPELIVGFVEVNENNRTQNNVYSIPDGLTLEYDGIVISVLGREEQISRELVRDYGVLPERIIILNTLQG